MVDVGMAPKPRAQAALEFLMGYGWALVAITIIGAALVAFTIPFGAPETCSGFGRLHYRDHALGADGNFAMALQNGTGQAITIDSVEFSGAASGSGTAEPSVVLTADLFTIRGPAFAGSAGSAYDATISITYTKESGIRVTESGACTGARSRDIEVPDFCMGVTCEDHNPCTADECNPADGQCDYTALPDGTPCLEGNCEGGNCIRRVGLCTDHDGGFNDYIKSRATRESSTQLDWCSSDTLLIEGYCSDGGALGGYPRTCPQGTHCEPVSANGACVPD